MHMFQQLGPASRRSIRVLAKLASVTHRIRKARDVLVHAQSNTQHGSIKIVPRLAVVSARRALALVAVMRICILDRWRCEVATGMPCAVYSLIKESKRSACTCG